MHAILKENTTSYISLERLIDVDFGKNMNRQFFFTSAEENCNNESKNDQSMQHSMR